MNESKRWSCQTEMNYKWNYISSKWYSIHLFQRVFPWSKHLKNSSFPMVSSVTIVFLWMFNTFSNLILEMNFRFRNQKSFDDYGERCTILYFRKKKKKKQTCRSKGINIADQKISRNNTNSCRKILDNIILLCKLRLFYIRRVSEK